MADRLSSEHSSVRAVRATIADATTGKRVEIPAAETEGFPTDEVVRIDLDETERFARIERPLTGDGRVIDGVYGRSDAAREPGTGTDRLPDWCSDHEVRDGGSVFVDVIEPGFAYGLRGPGETNYYDAAEPPKRSLSDIANDLE